MRFRKISICLAFLGIILSIGKLAAQNQDSLRGILNSGGHDTVKLIALFELAWSFGGGNSDSAMYYNQRALELSKANLKNPAAAVRKRFEQGIAEANFSIAYLYKKQGNFPAAIQLNEQMLKYCETRRDSDGINLGLNNLAAIYYSQGDTQKALSTFLKIAGLARAKKDIEMLAYSANNAAAMYTDLKDAANARKYFGIALESNRKIGDSLKVAGNYISLGMLEKREKNFMLAEQYYLNALLLLEGSQNIEDRANTLNNLGFLYFETGRIDEAARAGERGYKLAVQLNYPEEISKSCDLLSLIEKKKGNFQKALFYFEKYVSLKDSISNERTRKASIRSQLKYEFDKKAATDSVKNAELQKVKDARLQAQEAKIKQEKIQFWFLVCGLGFTVFGLGFVINRFRITQKQKRIIEEQKIKVDAAYHQLHEKNQEVLDSIYYARRIQRALITSEKYVDKHFRRLNPRRTQGVTHKKNPR